MNNSYKLVYSEALNTWVAVAEHVSARGKKSAVRLVTAAAIMAGGALGTGSALAAPPLIATPAVNQLPTGAQVTTGTVNISQTQTATAANMAIQQSSNQAIVNWQSFNVGANAKVNITQPSSTSVLLNRVMDSNPSQIFGQVNANGQVFLSNPNGVYFAPGSSVDVGSFTATTHSISDADFLAGKYNFSRNGATGSITNEGSIASDLGGYIALLAPEVRNQGVVVAKVGGTVVMAAGESYQLQFNSNNQLTNVLVTPSTLDTLVENGNLVQAPGGLIIMSAQAASSLLGGVVKNSGSISATGLVNDGGTIRLSASNKIELTSTSSISADAAPNSAGNGGRIDIITDLNNATGITKVDGSISAKGGELGGDGGFVDTSAARLVIGESTLVTTGAVMGNAGTWMLDPFDITIAGPAGTASGTAYADSFTAGATSTILASTISNALNAGSNVSISTGTTASNKVGSITVNSPITWSTAKTLTLTANYNININAAITASAATGAGVVLEFNQGNAGGVYDFGLSSSGFAGSINFGGNANTFSTKNYTATATSYQVITSLGATTSTTTGELYGINGGLSGNYALGGNINASGALTALGSSAAPFTGKFEGLGHNIIATSLTCVDRCGLFSTANSPLIQNLGLNLGVTNTGQFRTGALVGSLSGGTISNVFSNSSVSGSSATGGLVGYLTGGTLWLSNSYMTGTVGSSGSRWVGGLIGYSYGTAYIFNSYVTGAVGSSATDVGGLVGNMVGGVISNSYATGNVSSSAANADTTTVGTGGLIGTASASTIIINSYSTGNISAPNGSNVGGVVGFNAGKVTNTYASGSVSGASNKGGVVGKNTGTVTSSFWNTTTSGLADGIGTGTLTGVTGLTSSEMQQQSSFTSFDFSGLPIWAMGTTGNLNPVLSGTLGNIFLVVSGGAWSTASNWSLGLTPVNSNGNITTVINSGISVNYDTANTGSLARSIYNAGTISFSGSTAVSLDGSIAGSGALVNTSTGVVTLNGNNTFSGGTTITSGTVTAGSANALGTGAVSIGASGKLDLTYSGTVALGSTLSMSTGATITNSSNTSNLSVTGASTLLGSINTLGNQTYSGDVTFGANTSITTLNTSNVNTNGLITFGSTVNSSTGNYYGLTVRNGTGTTAFGGVVGGTNPLGYLCINVVGCSATSVGTASSSGTTTLAGNVTTSGTQTYGGNLTLGANTSLTSTANSGNGAITIAGALNSSASVGAGILEFLGGGYWEVSVNGGSTWAYYSGSTYQSSITISGTTYTSTASSLASPLSITYNAGVYSWTPSTTTTASYLLVGGGGSGGYFGGGGGGGGGVVTGSATLSNASYAITVGNGGTGNQNNLIPGANGFSSSIFGGTVNLTALGGGGGGTNNVTATGGASGGGGSGFGASPGAGSSSGNAGGAGGSGGTAGSAGASFATGGVFGGGGGGGESQSGNGGAGGAGVANPITGSNIGQFSNGAYYVAGGGGGSTNGGGSVTAGNGGLGGGGAGSKGAGGTNGLANTGGGGGGTHYYTDGASGGSGVVVLAGDIVSAQGTFSLSINSGSGKASIAGSVSNVSTLTINSTSALSELTGAIGGSTALTKSGAGGVLTLSGANTYTGGTTVSAGTLKIGNATALGGSGGAVSVADGAALDLNGTTLTNTNTLTLRGSGISGGGALTNSSSTAATFAGNIVLGSASSIGSAVGDITASGVVSGAFALTKVAAATLTLTGSNSYTGGTTISAGTLKVGHSNALGSSLGGAISVASLAALDLNGFGLSNISTLTLNGSGISSGGALTNSSTGIAISNPIVLASDTSIGSSTGNINLSGVISGTGNLTKIGSANSTLSGINTYTGTTTVSGSGILSISNAQGLGSTDGGTIVSSTGRLLINGLSVGAEAITLNGGSLEVQSGTSSLSGTVNVAANSSIRVDTGAQLTLSSVVYGAGRLTKTSGTTVGNYGTLVLTADNTYTGGTTISAGTLQLGAGSTTGTIAGNVTNNATLAFNRSDDLTFAGIISGTGAVTKLAANTLTFSGTNTYTGGTTISAGTLQIGAGSNIGSITGDVTNNATLAFNRNDAVSFSGVISGTGAVTKLGTGTTTLSGINIYTGSTTVSTGTLAISNAAGLGGTAGGTTVANGATLDLQGVTVGAEALTLNGATLSTSTGTSSLAGTVTLGDNSTANVAGTQLTLSGVVSGVGYGLTKTGTGSLVLSGTNTFTGTTSITSGTLAISNAAGLGGTSSGTTVSSGATLDLRGATVGAEAVTLSGGTLAATTGTSSLSGAVNLTSASSLSGAGALTLSGAITSNGNGLALIGTGAKTLSSTSNTLSTIASGSGVGVLNVVNNAALAIGQVTAGGSTYNGINSTGTVSVTTRTGDLTVSQNVVTTSTATSYTTPAIKLGAGSLSAAGTPTGGDVLLSGTPTISVGTGGVALIYSGYATTSAARTLANSFAPKLSYYSINSDSTYVPTTFAAAYYTLFRESPTTLYTLYVPGQTFTYGTPITSLNYCYSTSASSCAPVTATGVPSTTQAQAFNNLLLDAGTYPGTIAPAPLEITGYFFAAGNAVNIVVNPKAVTIANVASTTTYDGLSTYTNVANAMTYNISGLVGSDAVRSITQTPSNSVVAGNVANAGNFAVTPSAAVLSIGRASNYTFNYTSALATVSKANLTVKVKDDAKFVGESDNVAYDGVSYSGFVAGQTASVLSGAVAISRSNASVNSAGTYSGVLSAASSTLSSSNYNITYAPGNYTIIPADQLLIRLADTSTTYGTAPSYNLTSVQYKSSTGGTVVDLTSRAAVNSSAFTLADGAGGNTALTLGPLSSSLSSAGQVAVGNYQVGASSITNTSANYSNTVNIVGSLSVGQKSLTVAATSGLSKTYDGTTNMAGLGLGLTGLVGADAVSASGLGTYANANAGNNKSFDVSGISLSGADAANYKLASNTLNASTGVITAAPLLITANNDSKTYDAAAYTTTNAATAGVNYSGFVNGETTSVLSGTLSYGGTAIGAVNVGTYAIAPTGQTSSNYAITYGNGALNISPADVRVSATNVTLTGTVAKVYDGTTVATLTSNNYVTTGWQGSDGATITQTTGTYDNANAGTNKLVNVTLASSDYSATNGTLLSNYNLPTAASGYVGVITPKSVTVSNASRTTTYDGLSSYNALAAGTTYTVGAMVGSDTVSSISQTASGFSGGASGTAQAGTYTITPSAAVMGTGSASNYSFSYVSSNHTVNKATLNLAISKTYDGSTSFSSANANTYTFTGMVNSESAPTISAGAATTNNADVNTYNTFATNTLALSDGNYTLSGGTVAATITPKPVTVTNTARSTTYDGVTSYTTLATGTTYTVGPMVGSDGVASITQTPTGFSGASTGTAQAGTLTVTPSDAVLGTGTASNYSFSYVPSTHTVDKANLSVSATPSLTGNVYNGNAYTGTYTTNAVNGETFTVAGMASGTNAGTYTSALNVSGAALVNYNTPVITDANLVISPKPVTVTNTSRSTTYDGVTNYTTLATGTSFSVGAMVGSDAVASVTQTPSGFNGAATGVAQAGTFTVTPSAAALSTGTASNYNFSFVPSTHTVDKANLSVSATPSLTGNVYRGTAYTGSYTSTALNGETFTVTGQATGTNAGTYTSALNVSGAALANYNTPVISNANLVISPAPLSVTASNTSKTYDGAVFSGGNGVTYSGFVNNETSAVLGGTLGYAGTSQNAKNVGNYVITPNGLTSANYSVSFVDGSLTITPAGLNAIVASLTGSTSKVYDGNTNATLTPDNFAFSGFAAGEGARVSKTTGTFDNANAGSNKTVTVSLSSSDIAANSGTLLSNYTLPTSASGAIGTISKAPLSVTASNTSKTYDGAVFLGGNGVTYSGFVNNETTAALGGTLGYAGSSQNAKNVGNYVITPNGLTSANYSVNFVDGSLTISPAGLNAIVASLTGSTSKVYDGNTVATLTPGNFAFSGFVAGEGASVSKTTGTFDNANTGSNKIVSVSLSSSDIAANNGTLLSNYTLPTSATGAIGNITKAPLSVTASNTSKTYDGAVFSGGNGVTYSGFVNNETSAVLGGTLGYAGTSQNAKNIGNYVITPNGLTSANYSVSFVDGSLTINPAGLNAIVASLTGSTSKVYDGNTAATLTPGNFAFSGFVAGEGASVSKTSGTFDNANAGTNKTVTASLSSSDIAANSGTLLSNYTLPTSASGAIGTISKAPLSAALTGNTTKVYDGNATASLLANNFVISGFANAEGASVSQTNGSFTDKNTGTNKGVTTVISINDIAANNGTLLSNYTLPTSASGNIGTITPANLTLTAITNTKNFDGKNDALAVPTASGLIGSDTVTGLAEAYSDVNPGTRKTLNVQTGYQISDGNNGNNYKVTLVPDQTGEIRAQAVAVLPPAAASASTTYAPPTLTVYAASGTSTAAASVPAAAPAPAATSASSSASSGSTAASSSVAAGSSSGVVVNTINSPTTQVTGLVAVLVPAGTATAGTGLVIALPEQVLTTAAPNSAVQVTLPNNEPLPSWIRYEAATQTLVTTAVPSGAFPLSVVVTTGGQSTLIQISESKPTP